MAKLLGTFGKTARGQTVAPQKYYMVELPAMKLLVTKLLAVVKMSRSKTTGTESTKYPIPSLNKGINVLMKLKPFLGSTSHVSKQPANDRPP